jgi:rare lipoprotein A
MDRRAKATMLAVLCLGVPGALAPAADAQSGGTVAGGDSGPADNRSSGPGDPGLRASAGALRGRAQTVSGALEGAPAGRAVEIQLGAGDGQWTTVAQAQTTSDGAFAATWRAERTGRFTLRALISRGSRAGASRTSLTAPVTVYDAAVATMFGPGLFGRRTACGTRLGPATVGLAHRTLACGTRVEVYYGGRRVVASVIDRGPFVAGVTWDLTSATATALGFSGRGYVGTFPRGRGSVPLR